MEDDQQFCLRWNNHQSTLVSVFDNLLEKGIHVDCTLAAEGQTLKAHKVVLSACSPYFENVLLQQFDKHPIIILKDVKFAELKAMMDYMYRGEVNISQDQLAALLKAAESLQIKGLSDNKPSRPPSRPPHANNAHPQRAPSPKPQVRDGSVDSREGSVSPTRRRKKVRRMSADGPPHVPSALSQPPPPPPIDHDDSRSHCKEEGTRDGVDDLTIDEDPDDKQPTHNDVVRNFEWHMERSRDDMMNSSDSIRDSQEPRKELPSALLSLLSHAHAQAPGLVPSLTATTTGIMKPANPFHALHKLPIDIPDNFKAHLLQHAFMQNNNTQLTDYKHLPKPDEQDSDGEYDDTDDIVLPEEGEPFYESNSNQGGSMSEYEAHMEAKVFAKRGDGNSSDDASRQFECRHCGKKYRWKSTLRRHENVECGGKPPSHQCPYCSYKAKQRGNLGVHIRKHHNTEWYIYASNKVRRTKKTPT